MRHFRRFRSLSALVLASILVSPTVHSGDMKPIKDNPDFTKEGSKAPMGLPENALGTTGAFGWIYHTPKELSSDGVTQVYVFRVAPKTPADGVLQKGDVILGAAGGPTTTLFKTNARHELGMALVDAESEKNKGVLALNVWRAGKTLDIQLTIPVVTGDYDQNGPATCERTQTVITELAAAIEKRGLDLGSWKGVYDALGLLATGDPKYHPTVKKLADSLAITKPLDLNSREKRAWIWGYNTLFLAEYYGATGDESVLPHLTEYATKLAMGQGYAGTWNHSLAHPDLHENGGQLHGRLGGYGAINQTSLSCAIALVVAQKVGVDNKEISDAVRRSTEHFLFFVDKGSIPYGDHAPRSEHAENGKNASTAVFFDLIGQKEGARYFSRMTMASYRERETGHTGHFFSQLWGGMGVACSGDAALNAYTKELQYYYQLERRPGGVCLYQPIMNASWGRYRDWSMNGCRLLQYCAPRKVLYITGKARTTPTLEGQDLADTIAAGRADVCKGRSVKELLALLGSWSPVVREAAASALGKQDESLVPQLIAMLESENRYARYGACVGLKHAGRGSVEAVDALIEKGLKSTDLTMRYYAASAFSIPRTFVKGKGWTYPENGLGDNAMRGSSELLRLAVAQDPVSDPRNKIHFLLGEWLFYDGNVANMQGLLAEKDTLAAVDRKLLVEASRSILTNQNGRARSAVAKVVYPVLTKAERKKMHLDIVTAVRERAPSGIMFSTGVRKLGIALLVEDKAPEVPELCGYLLAHHEYERYPEEYIKPLASYGNAAKSALPGLRTFLANRKERLAEIQKKAKGNGKRAMKWKEPAKENAEDVKKIEDLISAIESIK